MVIASCRSRGGTHFGSPKVRNSSIQSSAFGTPVGSGADAARTNGDSPPPSRKSNGSVSEPPAFQSGGDHAWVAGLLDQPAGYEIV
jgi:hypothetical protein